MITTKQCKECEAEIIDKSPTQNKLYCKACRIKKNNTYKKEYNKKNKELINAKYKLYRIKYKDKLSSISVRGKKSDVDIFKKNLKKYGFNINEYLKNMILQHNKIFKLMKSKNLDHGVIYKYSERIDYLNTMIENLNAHGRHKLAEKYEHKLKILLKYI